MKSYKFAKAILYKLEDMFRSQAALARYSAITSSMNSYQTPRTPIKDHMITLMRYSVKVANN
ncbi:hypothetical protein PVK06_004536 [Gossypium arboreum]|uniref:Uncharacterized protein n=1 Tax=Gossypium arboreum TaxID=29729 RepID=A0ABR0QSA0_GOSAR|nr:hypothetical protein PVK06_004536 [Gossypium arboreum]